MVRRVALLIVLLLPLTGVSAQDNLKFGQPACPGRLLDKTFFVICYNPSSKIPVWVGYTLTADDLRGTTKRTDDFHHDTTIPQNERSELADYAKSGYDRGHMAPAGDFVRSKKAMSTSFLLSNMAPQRHGLNAGRWEGLESAVRDLARSRGTVWLFTGPIFIGNKPIKEIGPDKVDVPTHFYKVILCVRPNGDKEMFAFIMPNIPRLQTGLAQYAVSADLVEQLTGLDFFSALPQAEQDQLESQARSLPPS